MPKPQKPLIFRQCQKCGETYAVKRPWQKYCGRFCTQAAFYARHTKPPHLLDDPQIGPSQYQLNEQNSRGQAVQDYDEETLEQIEERERSLERAKIEKETWIAQATQTLKPENNPLYDLMDQPKKPLIDATDEDFKE
jgi:hypothetical protein